jgi:tetratricopeptide (TPR) repeat protein
MAEEASRAGNVQEAEDLYRKAFQLPNEGGDSYWLTGSYSVFLREHGRTDEALTLLRKSVSEGSDSRYLWGQLIDILAGRYDVSGVMDVLGKVPAHVIPTDQVAPLLMGYTHRRDRDLVFCERLCKRALEFTSAAEDQQGVWLVAGCLGGVLEASGQVDEALSVWKKAFEEGSDDPTTAVRLSMALDKAKRYDEAQGVIVEALTRGLPASSEENLRKRLVRLEARTSNSKVRKDVDAFSERFGEGHLRLKYQVRLKPTLKEVAVLGKEIRAHCSVKEINEAVRINLETGDEIGRSTWPQLGSHVAAPGGWGLGERNPSRVGSGPAELTFFGPDDSVVATSQLPDSTSGSAFGSDQWYVGCRDGRLYCFSREGVLKWKWVTPGADDPIDDVYARPCPYFVAATDDFVTFSSWGQLFALSNDGKTLWQRGVPDQGPMTVTIPLGGSVNTDSWKVLDLSRGASDDDIKRAYHRLALETHPDRNPNDLAAADHFRTIQSAYESLLAAPHQGSVAGSVIFTITSNVLVGKLFALNNEIVVASSDGVIAFLNRAGEVKNRRVLGKSTALPVFDSGGTLRTAFCDGILSFIEGDSIINATELEDYPDSISLWGDEVIVAHRNGLTLFSGRGVKLWKVEFSKRLIGFSAEGELLVCSAGALIVFEKASGNI